VRRTFVLLAAVATALAAAPAASAQSASRLPELLGRAILPADASAPAPFPGVPNTDPAPAPGARQPVGGFSALLDAGERNTYWAMPDNGFGSKANSRSFLLRVYLVRADFETRRGGSGEVEILDWITLRDPDGKVPWAIVNEDTPQRLLTGGDLDIESMRVDRNGDLWFGEEFGPFLVHTDATGKVLEAPIPLPGVSSPDYPADAPGAPGARNLPRSNGFEGMAISRDGRTLFPILEGAVAGDDPRLRRLYTFDIDARRYEPGYARYEVADPAFLVADLTRLDDRRFIALERDNSEGAAARHKKAFVVDPRVRTAGEVLIKRQVVDLLALRDPNGISLPGRPGDLGLGDSFSMPYVTIESVLPLGGNRVAFVNDTNFGSRGRNPQLPDPSDFIVVRVPRLAGFRQDRHVLARPQGARTASTFAVLGDTPYGDEQRQQFPALVADVDADPDVEAVLHLGDIKSGGTTCSDERFADLRALFDMFDDPFVLTPGDNDWTDCHRASNGAYVPTERLGRLREVFFPEPGRALGGGELELVSQAQEPGRGEFVENRLWTDSRVVFSMVHVVGSNNGLAPWFGAAETPEQRELRLAEVEGRTAAALAWIDRTFDRAEDEDARGVVLAMQADTFVPGADRSGFTAVLDRLADRARRFGGAVLLLQGDTHEYLADRPFEDLPNVERVVVEGETAKEWLRLRVDPRADDVFAWERRMLP
jgi:hypothetical protein